jgi:hypothetical protein
MTMARPRAGKKGEPTAPATSKILPMELRIGDRIADETGEWEVIGRPYTTAGLRRVRVGAMGFDACWPRRRRPVALQCLARPATVRG